MSLFPVRTNGARTTAEANGLRRELTSLEVLVRIPRARTELNAEAGRRVAVVVREHEVLVIATSRDWNPRTGDLVRALADGRACCALGHVVLRVVAIGTDAPVMSLNLLMPLRVELLEIDAVLLVEYEGLIGPRHLLLRIQQAPAMMARRKPARVRPQVARWVVPLDELPLGIGGTAVRREADRLTCRQVLDLARTLPEWDCRETAHARRCTSARPEADCGRGAGLVVAEARARTDGLDQVDAESSGVEGVVGRRGPLEGSREHDGAQASLDCIGEHLHARREHGPRRMVRKLALGDRASPIYDDGVWTIGHQSRAKADAEPSGRRSGESELDLALGARHLKVRLEHTRRRPHEADAAGAAGGRQGVGVVGDGRAATAAADSHGAARRRAGIVHGCSGHVETLEATQAGREARRRTAHVMTARALCRGAREDAGRLGAVPAL